MTPTENHVQLLVKPYFEAGARLSPQTRRKWFPCWLCSGTAVWGMRPSLGLNLDELSEQFDWNYRLKEWGINYSYVFLIPPCSLRRQHTVLPSFGFTGQHTAQYVFPGFVCSTTDKKSLISFFGPWQFLTKPSFVLRDCLRFITDAWVTNEVLRSSKLRSY